MSDETSRLAADPPTALPRGTRLGEFELLRVLGVGGFGIVYLAFDHALEREVAVKEYMPASLAGRTETLHVSLRSQSDADTFALGLKSFVNEARMLARFDHPSLLKVHRFWEANNTAYMAMPVYRGQTFKDVRAGMAMPPDETWLRAQLMPLLGAIEKLHGEGVYHRDIAPDNIIIEPDGHPVLLDFGAARRVISDKSQTLTAILKPAYAPIEQYAEAGSVKQGPWTDLYALGATVHYMLLGRPPLPATARAVHDDLAPLSGQPLPGCSDAFLHVIDWMLAPRPADRPQSVAAVRDVLEGRAAAPQRRAAPAEPPPGDWERTQIVTPPPTTGAPRTTAPAPASAAGDDVTVIRPPQRAASTVPPPQPDLVLPPPPPAAPPPPPAAPAATPAAAPALAPRSKLLPVLFGAVVVVGAAAAMLWPKAGTAPAAGAAASPAAAASAPVVVAASAPAPASVVAAVPVAASMAAPAAPAALASTPPAKLAHTQAEQPKPQSTPHKPAAKPSTRPVEPAPEPQTAVVVEPPKPAPVVVAPPVVVASAPAPKPAAASAPPPLAGPNERCGGRVVLALWLCIERECRRPELQQHPECVKWRADQAEKANPTR